MKAPGTGSRGAVESPAAHALFAAFVDYAGLFPPAALGLDAAVAEYDRARHGPFAWMLGRYIVPAGRLPELLHTASDREPFALSVIVDAELDPRAWSSGMSAKLEALSELRTDEPRDTVGALEVLLPGLQALRDTYDAPIGQFAAARAKHAFGDVPAYVEIPRDARWGALLPGPLAALARHRLRAKLRCGGPSPEAVPSSQQVADFIRAACDAGVPFKATAGLHHPVRHLESGTGTMQHGFLNLISATLLARAGEGDSIEAAVAEEDAAAFVFESDAFAWRNHRFDLPALASMRESFVGYGSCSFDEPVDDLVAMRVLEAAP